MKRTGEGMRQNNKKQIIEFIRENALVLEKGSRPIITGKGERFLQILSETTTARSNSGLGVL
jgi:hypothetical protein